MKQIFAAIALQFGLAASLSAQEPVEKRIDQAMKDPKTAERSARADLLLFDKTQITSDATKAAPTNKLGVKHCRRGNTAYRKKP